MRHFLKEAAITNVNIFPSHLENQQFFYQPRGNFFILRIELFHLQDNKVKTLKKKYY